MRYDDRHSRDYRQRHQQDSRRNRNYNDRRHHIVVEVHRTHDIRTIGLSETHSPDRRRDSRRTPGSDILCFECGGRGHISSICPNNSRRDRAQRDQSKSPTRDRNQSGRSPSPGKSGGSKGIRFNPARTSTVLLEYFVNVKVNGVPIRCLVDCGSATSSMQASLYSHRFGNIQELTNTGEVAVAFNGATSPIHGTFNSEAIFETKAYPIHFKIVDGSQYEAIIGLDFLDRYSTSMEFQKGILKLDSW